MNKYTTHEPLWVCIYMDESKVLQYFSLVAFYSISTLVAFFMPNTVFIYIITVLVVTL